MDFQNGRETNDGSARDLVRGSPDYAGGGVMYRSSLAHFNLFTKQTGLEKVGRGSFQPTEPRSSFSKKKVVGGLH